jgi:two-component system, chemotaxis family, chemotaxis protein CheY
VLAAAADTWGVTSSAFASAPEAVSEPHVLVVDDDPAMTEMLFSLLAPFCEVHIEHDGFAGLSAFRRALHGGRPFDLVCLDLLMPGMDGRRTLRAIRRLEAGDDRGSGHRARVLMMTALHERELVIDAVQAGVDDFLVKPFEPANFLMRLGLIPASEAPAGDDAAAPEV